MKTKRKSPIQVLGNKHAKDYRITLPNGEVVLLQYRTEGDYPSLDICFERQRVINPFMADLSPAVKLSKARDVDERLCEQVWVGLDPSRIETHDANWIKSNGQDKGK